MRNLKIAIVHDHLLEFGGAERVLVALKKVFPEADVFTAFINWDNLGVHRKLVSDWKINTSWAEKIPFLKRFYSPLRWLGPYIWDSFNFNGYDVVISSSATLMSKGVVTKPETVHICYLHHPPRYLYYYETAVEWQKYWPIRIYGHFINLGLRMYDYLSSQRVDFFVSNSEETKRRVAKFYRRESDVIYPPVDVPEAVPQSEKGDYYITISRIARAKHIDVLVKAAVKYNFKLKVVGFGRDKEYLQSIANDNVEFVGEITDEQRDRLISGAKAFLFGSVDEEFGIAPVEAMGYGVPVIAYASGGLKETVKPGENGYLYEELHEDSLYEQIKKLEDLSDTEYKKLSDGARKESLQYSFAEFEKQIKGYVASKVKDNARTT